MLTSALMAMLMFSACHNVDDDRIPRLPVSINLADPGLWNTFGVPGVGLHRDFIMEEGKPAGFHYMANSATGFGGVLLIGGTDPFTSDPNVPLAYDLSCPVERKRDIRVVIDDATLEAVCPLCDSHYNVINGGGGPVSGPALTGQVKYGLRRYQCLPGRLGGYLITD